MVLRSVDDAISAVQKITLRSGGVREPWIAALQAIHNFRQLVHNSLSNSSDRKIIEPSYTSDDEVHLSRRVFTKVHRHVMHTLAHPLKILPQVQPGGSQMRTVLKAMDDPGNKAQNIESSWIVADMLPIGQRMSDGQERQCSQLLLSEGDFVDVGISFGIVSKRRKVSIHLVVEYISQLVKANDVAKVRRQRILSSLSAQHAVGIRSAVLYANVDYPPSRTACYPACVCE